MNIRGRPFLRLCAALTLLIPAVASSPAAAATKRQKHLSCQAYVPARTVAALSGVPTKLAQRPASTRVDFEWAPVDGSTQGNVPGTTCQWIDNPDPPGWGFDDTAEIGLGWGYSNHEWTELKALYRSGNGWFSGTYDFAGSTYRTLKPLLRNTKAFLVTYDLWATYGISGPSDDAQGPPIFPHYAYLVTAMSKHLNLIQVWIIGASLAKTERLVTSILRTI